MNYFKIIISGILLLSLNSCVTYIRKRDKHHRIVEREYNMFNNIVLHDAIICGNYREGLRYNNESIKINQDSIFQMFSKALSRLPISVNLKPEIRCHCDSSFQNNHLLGLKNVDKEQIKNLGRSNSADTMFMIPTIYIDTWDVQYTGVTASSGGTVNNKNRYFHIYLLISLVHHNEIIYYRKIVLRRSGIDFGSPYNMEEIIQQKHWDKLVELTMRDYIKRLK